MSHNFRAHWSNEDGEFVGTCDTYPSVSWLEPTEGEALNGIMMLVADIDNDTEV